MHILFNILYGIYGLIAYLVPLYFFLIALIKIKQKSRFIFLGFIVILYILPFVISLPLKSMVLFLIRIVLGIGCYLYLLSKGISLQLKVT